MPRPITGTRWIGACAPRFVRGRRETATIEQGIEVTAVALGSDRFEHEGWGRFARDTGTQLASRYSMHALNGRFFVPDDAAGNMPARAVVIIISPGEEGSVALVVDEEIDVDERGDAADE